MTDRDANALRVLTLYQPYATLVALGVKTIATRSWSTNVRGRVAIHAAARPFVDLHLGAIVATAELYDCVPIVEPIPMGQFSCTERVLQVGNPDQYRLTLINRWKGGGEVVGRYDDELSFGNFEPGRWAWLLRDIEPLDQPIPFKGGQGWSRSWTTAAASVFQDGRA